MARHRRSKTSPAKDLVQIVALMPWWACVGLASLSYLILHAMAKPVVLIGLQPGQLTPAITSVMFQSMASVGQYVVPVLCLAAAAVSVANRRRRSGLATGVAVSKAPDALDGMSWQDFELLVGEAFRLQGYEVTELGGAGPDGGVDLVLRRGGEKFLVQCKQWRAFKVGVTVVRELYGIMAAKGAAGGFVVDVCERAQRHPCRRAEALWTDPAGQGGAGEPGEGGSACTEAAGYAVSDASGDSCRGGRRFCNRLPHVLRSDGAAGRHARRERRQQVLGLRRLSELQGHQAFERVRGVMNASFCRPLLRSLVLAFAVSSLCGAAAAANRCTDPKGKVTYQDTACNKEAEANAKVDTSEGFSTRATPVAKPRPMAEHSPPNQSSGASGDYATYRGSWRGPLQLELSLNGVRDGDAHAMAPMVVELRPDGEVVGQGSTSGCKFSGLATQNFMPSMASLDVSLKGCTDERFNTRYSGSLVAVDTAKEARLHLVGVVMRPAASLTIKVQQVSIDAVLKR